MQVKSHNWLLRISFLHGQSAWHDFPFSPRWLSRTNQAPQNLIDSNLPELLFNDFFDSWRTDSIGALIFCWSFFVLANKPCLHIRIRTIFIKVQEFCWDRIHDKWCTNNDMGYFVLQVCFLEMGILFHHCRACNVCEYIHSVPNARVSKLSPRKRNVWISGRVLQSDCSI